MAFSAVKSRRPSRARYQPGRPLNNIADLFLYEQQCISLVKIGLVYYGRGARPIPLAVLYNMPLRVVIRAARRGALKVAERIEEVVDVRRQEARDHSGA